MPRRFWLWWTATFKAFRKTLGGFELRRMRRQLDSEAPLLAHACH
jgi:myosin-crossreactive antigen